MRKEVKDRLAEMGVTERKLRHAQAATTQEAGEQRLEDLKAVCKEGFRKLALELHPDVTGNDPEKTARFKRLKSIYESFQKAQYKGWRKGRAVPRDSFDDLFGSAYADDPLMRNFWRLKHEAKQRRKDNLSSIFEEALRQAQQKRHAPAKPTMRQKPSRIVHPLAGRKGIWLAHLGRLMPQHKSRDCAE
jgi:hypothetical protein